MSHTFTFTREPIAVFRNPESIWAMLRIYAPETGKKVDDDPYVWIRVSSHVDGGPEAENGGPDIELLTERLAENTIKENKLRQYTLKRDLEEEKLEAEEIMRKMIGGFRD